MKDVLVSWIRANWSLIAWLITGLVVVVLRARTPAQWVALGEKKPRTQGAIRMLRGLGLDPAKVLDGLMQLLTGRVRPAVAAQLSASQRAGLERARNALLAVAAVDQSDEDRAALSRINELLAGDAKQAPTSSDPPSSPGFVERSVIMVIGGIAALFVGVMLLSGCPLPAPDGCTPFATRCGPSGIPQTCSGTQRWSHGPATRPCAELGAVCCRATTPYGNEIHACVPASACLPERVNDAGAPEEGGAL